MTQKAEFCKCVTCSGDQESKVLMDVIIRGIRLRYVFAYVLTVKLSHVH